MTSRSTDACQDLFIYLHNSRPQPLHMWCLRRRKPSDIDHIKGSHLVHYARYVDEDLLCRIDDHQRRIRWLLCCQVRAVWRDRMDWRYLLRVRKHLLRYKPVLLSVCLK